MLGKRSSGSRNFFRKLVVNGVNNSKAAIQNGCLMRLYDADAELKAVSNELDTFDGRKDPIRCNVLVNQLRTAQDKVITLLFQLMDDCNCERASRDYRMKFPDEILLSDGSESLNGQIWFGAECLSAGSNILNHTKESTMLRPMAKTLTMHLDSLRNDLCDLVVDGGGASRINQALIKKMVTFDHIFATFEYEYVRTMLPIRTVAEIEKLQEVAVLFSETLIDCVKRGLIKQEDIDEFEPIVMIAIPRLAIVRGLLYKNENPIYTRHKSQMCSLFQPFHGPLHSIRRLLRGLSSAELFSLEKMLANDQTAIEATNSGSTNLTKEPSTSASIINEQDESMQSNNFYEGEVNRQDGGDCEDGASTSNNYSNVLMDGLQYPVGQKRDMPSPSYLDDDIGENSASERYFEAPASSSKSLINTQSPEDSPVGSTPSSSSSLSRSAADCRKSNIHCPRVENVTSRQECDRNCCRSPPESDTQLEQLIAEFGPSITSYEPEDPLKPHATSSEENLTNERVSPGHERSRTTSSGQPEQTNDSNTVDDEAHLEELFQKQAQQLLHRLFVAISGVADQLQSNFASDLRFILRHIFSSDESDSEAEDDEEELDSDDRDYSNNVEHSDSSLPYEQAIEQAVEAQEIANVTDIVNNLIDLSSSYSIDNTYDTYGNGDNSYPDRSNLAPLMDSNRRLVNDDSVVAIEAGHHNRSTPSSSVYVSAVHHPDSSLETNSTGCLFNEDELVEQNVTEEQVARLSRPLRDFYESRLQAGGSDMINETRRRQHLVQQHLQSILRANRSSPSSRTHRQQGYDPNGGNSVSHSHSGERRSRHHGSRSRRSRGPPVWVEDHLVVACSCCKASFTMFRRRHHCRACGQIFCGECSKFTKNLSCWGYDKPVRVCESCYNQP